ncbi:Ras-related protein Rab-12 [Aix galericulata]|nr:Ras-related protein Rab-12 [Aix galericulata]
MEPGSGLPQRRAGGGGGLELGAGSAGGSPALSGGQARRRKQPPRPADFKLQVIIIGSRGVGKTSLMERFTDDTFCEACKSTVGKAALPCPVPVPASPRCPRGVDFKIKTVELRGKKIRLQIWDTAGQERFNSITSAYYRSAKGIILVYDITKKETFDDLPKWMKMIDKYASEDAELLLVGNKLDCEVDREISRQQGEKFAQQITGMRFCEASAKDNFNVDEIFLKLVDDILKKMPLDVIRNELSNSILSLQPEPEIPPELPPPRPHNRDTQLISVFAASKEGGREGSRRKDWELKARDLPTTQNQRQPGENSVEFAWQYRQAGHCPPSQLQRAREASHPPVVHGAQRLTTRLVTKETRFQKRRLVYIAQELLDG